MSKMHITEQRIAEIFDYSRFEPSHSMETIITRFAQKFGLAQNNTRQKVSFGEISGDNSAKTAKQPDQEGLSKSSEKKKGKSF